MSTFQQSEFRPRSNFKSSLTALFSIVSRDLLIIRRELIPFLLQTLMQPILLLFVLGKVFLTAGPTGSGFSAILLPGILALTIFMTAFQASAIDLGRDLNVSREIDDRLLAPLPISLVAVEKLLLATLRALIGGALVFPLALWILGSGYQVRTDMLGIVIALMILIALMSSALGLMLSTIVPIQLFPLVFALVLSPLMFMGATFYPWASLESIKWFQIVTLFNPLTYAAEGLRYAMVPLVYGQPVQTLGIGWVLLVLSAAFVLCFGSGLVLFRRRVVS
ncbi:MAG TPA: ABC transporter permease [Ktedonobacteraceae bacterium]|nr:ABC transporter permease [Ktedonobacteraceae bacterium]